MKSEFILKELSRYKLGTHADIIYRNAILYPEQDAFVYKSQRVTFSDFNARVNKLINSLHSMGVKKGDVIGVLSWNCLEYADVYGAAMKGGFIASPFNPRLGANELSYILNYSEANTLFVGPELANVTNSLRKQLPGIKNYISLEAPADDMVYHNNLLDSGSGDEPDVKVKEDDPVMIVYTSGTTGVPRGALYTQSRLLDNTKYLVITMGLQPGDRHVQVMPLFHIGGGNHFRAFLYIGGANIIMHQRNFDAAATLKTLQDEKATDIDIVPTHLVAMFAVPDLQKHDLSNLKRMWYAASPMPVEILKKGIEKFGFIFAQAYGQTETGPDITDLPRQDHKIVYQNQGNQNILASAGRPTLGVHVRIVDKQENDVKPGTVGEVIVESKHIMNEYWRKPEDTKDTIINDWLHTGDLGYYDEKGYIFLVDRKKDMIVTGGENVFSREVEEVLYTFPAIQEAAVIGIPDPVWVEKVHAVVKLKPGATATAEEIIAYCKARLAGYKAPKSVEFTDNLPLNPAGKIMKKELRAKYWPKK